MLKFLFFTLGVIAIMYEFWALHNYSKLAAFRAKLKLADKENIKSIKFTNMEGTLILCHLMYFAWCFLGLLSSQWILFIIIILLSFLHGKLWSKAWNIVDSILTILILIFAMLNAIHLHIDIPTLLWNGIFDNK